MSSSSTSKLGLFKATAGTGEPFRTSDVNSNWDKVDAEAVSVDSRLDAVEANNWVTTARSTDKAVTVGKLADALDLSGKSVYVAAPTLDAMASTKKYVDDTVGGLNSAWTVVSSPTFGGLVTDRYSAAVRYQQTGKTVRFSCRVSMVEASPVSGQLTFTLPVAGPVGVVNVVGTANTSGAAYPLVFVRSSNVLSLFAQNSAGTYVSNTATSATVPFTWAAGHFFEISGTYEIS